MKKISWPRYLVLVLFISGCSGLPGLTPTPQVELPLSTSQPTQSVKPWHPAAPTSTRQGPVRLRIWVPPALSPAAGEPAGELIQSRLDEFQSRNPNVIIETRVKASEGPGGLLDTLSSASAAAPAALPDLVALPRDQLEAAALKGLILPIDDLTTVLDDQDWYPYAVDLAHLQNKSYGFPFAGDVLAQIYHTDQISEPLTSWTSVLQSNSSLAFSAASETPLFTLAQYQANEGQVLDDQGRPFLNSRKLGEVLSFYQSSSQAGIMQPELLTAFQNDDQVWEAFTQNRVDVIVTWASRVLQNPAAGTAIAQIPTPLGEPFTLASGWVWALVGSEDEKILLAADLAEFLTDSHFLADWTQASGYLPTRPSSLDLWTEAALKEQIGKIAAASRLIPPSDVMASLEAPLQQAVLQVLTDQAVPLSAAQAAASALTAP